jgi:hypothetical protein
MPHLEGFRLPQREVEEVHRHDPLGSTWMTMGGPLLRPGAGARAMVAGVAEEGELGLVGLPGMHRMRERLVAI